MVKYQYLENWLMLQMKKDGIDKKMENLKKLLVNKNLKDILKKKFLLKILKLVN